MSQIDFLSFSSSDRGQDLVQLYFQPNEEWYAFHSLLVYPYQVYSVLIRLTDTSANQFRDMVARIDWDISKQCTTWYDRKPHRLVANILTSDWTSFADSKGTILVSPLQLLYGTGMASYSNVTNWLNTQKTKDVLF